MNYLGFRTRKQNKFIMWCALAVAVLGIGVSTFFASRAVEDNKGYRTIGVVEPKGNVTVVKDGIDYKAYPGMHLQEGYILVTAGESSVRLVLDGDKYIKVESGSRVVFEKLGFLGSGKTKIILERGSMTGELVNPLEVGQEFVVNTPNAVLAVRGTFFRVELESCGIREVRTNVLTYGGAVATKRIFPTGEMEEEEVLVESGFKTAIHMNTEDTIYVLERTEGYKDTTKDNRNNIEPIYREDIADEDWVDIYYSAENGHQLFVTSDEAKKEIEERNISLENTTPIYEMTSEIFPETEGDFDNEEETVELFLNILTDDSKALAMAEVKEDVTVESLNGNKVNIEGQELELQSGFLTDGSGKENKIEDLIVEEIVESIEEEFVEEATEEIASEDEGPAGEGSEEETDSRDESGNVGTNGSNEDNGVTEDTEDNGTTEGNTETSNNGSAGGNTGSSTDGTSGGGTGNGGTSGSGSGGTHTHTEEYVGSEAIHSKCGTCGETLSATHEYTDEVILEATCTEEGTRLYSCTCGYSYEEVIDATGHAPVSGGEAVIHSKCNTCGETLSAAHEYTDEVTQEATCTGEGTRLYSCACGYSYEEAIDATGHAPVSGGEAGIHTKCNTCGETLSATHEYTDEVTQEATCTAVGERLYSCACGYSYTEEIPTAEHNYITTINAPTDTQDGNKYDTCDDCGEVANEEIIWGINSLNFPDEAFRNYVEATYNTDGEVGLCETEVAAATSITITADVEAENLYGIELFTSLETLVVESSYVQEIDVSSNAELSTLTVSSATGLTTLNCSYTAVSSLNADGLNNLTTINATYCSNMYSLSAQNCSSLSDVDASYSSISNAYFNDSANLTSLNLAYARQLQRLQLMNCTGLTRDVSADVHSADITECGINSQDGYLIIKVTGTEIESRYSEVFGTTCVYGSDGYSYQGFEP